MQFALESQLFLPLATLVCGTHIRAFFYGDLAAKGFKMQESTKGISGHQGAGVVVAVADNVKELWKGGERL